MRLAGYSLLVLLLLSLAPPAGLADELRVATWNLEHLDDSDGEGCVGRKGADYAALVQGIEEIDADVVAFQEVENAVAARRVFPVSVWHVEMSGRPPMDRSRACWGRAEARLGHLGTGFAIRAGLVYRRNADLKALGSGDAFQRWGTDITVTAQGRELRLLSVHLRSGCWGAKQDRDSKRKKTCAVLRSQIRHIGAWADARRAEGAGFVILGDFNRRLTLEGDWAWRLLSPPPAALRLLTEGVPFRCDPRFPAFIDPSGRRRRRREDAGGRLVSGTAAAGTASRSLRHIGGFPGGIVGAVERTTAYSQTTPSPSPSRMKR